MIFRSCRDGTVSQVTLRRVDNSYVRDRYEVVFEDGRPGYSAVLDVSEEALRGDYDLAIDWTEITLIGNHSAQDTTRWPYGELVGSGANRTVLSEIIRSEEHTSELQSLMRISYAVFCLKKKKVRTNIKKIHRGLTDTVKLK